MKDFSTQECRLSRPLDNSSSAMSKERLTVHVMTAGQDLGTTTILYFTGDYTKHDLIEWFEEFELVASRNSWKSDVQKELLKNLIRDKRLSQLEFTDNYEENRRRLLATVYPVDISSKSMYKLEEYRQSDVFYFETFFSQNKTRS